MEGNEFFNELPSEYADLVLENLLALNRIDHEAEAILTAIAMNRAALVWTFFERRVRSKRDRDDRYEAIPYQFYDLAKALARDADLAVATLRKWYSPGDPMFRFTGGLMLQAVFPTFTDELASSLNRIIAGGSDEDYDFATRLLENYQGEATTHELIKELIECLPEDDPKLHRLEICLRGCLRRPQDWPQAARR